MPELPSDASRPHASGGAAGPVVLFLLLIFAAAIGVRVYHVTDPLLEFHVTRQYRSAVIARGLYLPYDTAMPAWAREIAVMNADQGELEPTIIEHLAMYGYRIAGGEHLWIGRLVSIAGWLIGGAAIWLTALRMMSAIGALSAVMVFLLVPYGVLASRSFQPDALMTAATAVAILQIVRFGQSVRFGSFGSLGSLGSRGATAELCAAIVATAIAAFIKPMSLFFTFGCFAAVVWPVRSGQDGGDGEDASWMAALRSRLFSWQTWAFLFLSIVPMAAYYAYGLFVTGKMQEQAGGRFLPELLLTRFFWSGSWATGQVVAGWWVWVLAAAGALMARPGLPRRLFVGFWGAYLLFGVVFTYHFATHDYYHLPALIILALGVGAAVARIEAAAGRMSDGRYQRAATVAAAILMLLTAGVWLQRSAKTLEARDGSAKLAVYERIGNLLHHSQRTIMLAHDYGMPLRYHGHLTGPSWPSAGDLAAAELGAGAGAADDSAWSSDVSSAERRFNEFYKDRSPEYFLITDFDSFAEQPDLKEFLDTKFVQLAHEDDFIIYDLRPKGRS